MRDHDDFDVRFLWATQFFGYASALTVIIYCLITYRHVN